MLCSELLRKCLEPQGLLLWFEALVGWGQSGPAWFGAKCSSWVAVSERHQANNFFGNEFCEGNKLMLIAAAFFISTCLGHFTALEQPLSSTMVLPGAGAGCWLCAWWRQGAGAGCWVPALGLRAWSRAPALTPSPPAPAPPRAASSQHQRQHRRLAPAPCLHHAHSQLRAPAPAPCLHHAHSQHPAQPVSKSAPAAHCYLK